MEHIENFCRATLPDGFHWYNEPPTYKIGNGLELYTGSRTDFWQRTHYGFRRDDGHFLFTELDGDFCLSTHVSFEPRQQYDQCGLMIRIDHENWIKVSTEYEDEEMSRLGSVVTNLGYSDWATQDVSSLRKDRWYQISRRNDDFKIEYSPDGVTWSQLRIAHLHKEQSRLQAGIYACSPIGKDFYCCFTRLDIGENYWTNEEN